MSGTVRSMSTGLALVVFVVVSTLGGCKCGDELCGDGEVSDAEECDDGNNDSGDGCSALCQLETGDEICDDGEDNDGDGDTDCDDSDCAGEPECTGGEDCDNGMDDDGDDDVDCDDADCAAAPNCIAPTEICDNGMDDDGDGDIDCDDAECAAAPVCIAPPCGNGILEAGEECDDGNTTPGDGCDDTCMLEAACTAATTTDVTANIDGANVLGTVGGVASFYQGSCDTIGTPSPEEVVMFVLTTETSLQISTDNPGTSFDTVLHLRAGDCDDPAAEVACDNPPGVEWANLRTCGLAAGVYYLFIDGNNGDSGDYELNLTTAPDITANIDGATIMGTTPGGDGDIDDAACDPGGAEGSEDVYQIVLTGPTDLRISTDNPGTSFDTVLFVRSEMCGVADEIACANDFASDFATVYLSGAPAGTYWIIVDGNNGDSGDYELSLATPMCGDGILDAPVGEQCDDGNTTPGDGCDGLCVLEPVGCSSMTPIPDITGNIDGANVTGMTPGGSGNIDDATCDAFGPESGEDIYQIMLTAAATDLRITTNHAGTDFDTVIHVRYQICDDVAQEVACDNNPGSSFSTVYLTGAPPGTYWIFVDGNNGDSGNYEMSLVTNPICGDGIVDAAMGELCDDGNNIDGDGCSAACFIELGMCVAPDDTANLSAGPDMLTIDTTGGSDDVDVPCQPGMGGSGADHWIEFDVPMAGMELTVDFDQGPSDHLFAVASDSGGSCTWVGCVDPFSAAMGTIPFPGLAAGTHYLVVDAFAPGSVGIVDVTMDLN